ncbi:luciferin 4-monooxygenase-like isoform X2 [Periplaneta americana]
MSSENILSGPEPLGTTPDISLGRYMYEALKKHGNKISMVDAVTGEARTFNDILRKSLCVAECLYVRGVKSGDVVAICSENNLDFILPVLATYYIGAACAPVNPNYTTREILHAMNISKPRIIFCSEKSLDCVSEAAFQVDSVKEIVVFGLPLSSKHKPTLFVSFLQNKSSSFKPLDIDYKDLTAAILSSSGTTGLPKGVLITQQNILTLLGQIRDTRFYSLQPNDVLLGLLPFYHAYGFMCQLMTTDIGIKVVIMNKFEEELFLKTIQNYKITVLTLVPPLVVFLAKSDLVNKYDLSSVRAITCGAAPLSNEMSELACKRLKLNHFTQGYGLTETTLGVIRTPTDRMKSGSSGILIPGVKCKVTDLETGKILGPNKKGELCFKGPLIMKGYYGDRQATSASIDADGFFHTGDVGYYDDEGFFYIVDRVKELIKYKGFQVAPAELEALLLTHPAVKDAGVIGIPDEVAGELPLAFVVKQPETSVSEEEIIGYVKG